MNKVRKMLVMALFVSLSLVMYYIENLLPSIQFVAPGVKLGLSNIIILICLVIYGFRDSFTVFFLKTLISSFFAAGFSSFMYSFVGGLFSLVIMFLLLKSKKIEFSLIGISVEGSVFFNIGQLLVASFILNNEKVFYYLPICLVFSVATGVFVGLVSILFLKNVSHLKFCN